eukprot:3008818-Rhodomonas_salina.2
MDANWTCIPRRCWWEASEEREGGVVSQTIRSYSKTIGRGRERVRERGNARSSGGWGGKDPDDACARDIPHAHS